jgi:DNA-binding transcriptional ArsR family regulator
MAAITRKSSKAKLDKPSKARPKSESKSSKDSLSSQRYMHARRASILLKHVSDPTRLQVILILAKGEQHVGTLCAVLGCGQPFVSHHLTLLRHAGIIAPRRQGANYFYALTDTGFALTKVVQSLIGDPTTERPGLWQRPTGKGSALIQLPRPVRGESTNAPVAQDRRSNVQDSLGEASWSLMNRRRAELIFKSNRGQLDNAEASELERLQTLSRSRMQREFPGPSLVDERLKEIEEKLQSDEVKNP